MPLLPKNISELDINDIVNSNVTLPDAPSSWGGVCENGQLPEVSNRTANNQCSS